FLLSGFDACDLHGEIWRDITLALTGAEMIERAYAQYGQTVTLGVLQSQHILRNFADPVWTGWVKRRIFGYGGILSRIYLGRTDNQQARLDVQAETRQNEVKLGADIVFQCFPGGLERAARRCLCCQMIDILRLCLLKQMAHSLLVTQVKLVRLHGRWGRFRVECRA